MKVIELDEHDKALIENVICAIEEAIQNAHEPVALKRRIAVITIGKRNRGREAARKRHPFPGVCEASGLPLDERDANLDELDGRLGYAGPVRWVCPKANNSGKRSCGKC